MLKFYVNKLNRQEARVQACYNVEAVGVGSIVIYHTTHPCIRPCRLSYAHAFSPHHACNTAQQHGVAKRRKEVE